MVFVPVYMVWIKQGMPGRSTSTFSEIPFFEIQSSGAGAWHFGAMSVAR